MKLYSFFRSSAAFRTRIALNVKGLAHDQVSIHLSKDGGKQNTPDFQAVNPQKRVPALALDGGEVLTQSMAIIEYLDEIHPEPALLPRDPLARAKVRALAQLIACDIHPLNNTSPLRYLKSPLGHDQAAIDAWYHHWVLVGFEALETMLQPGPYSFGDKVTLADICLVPQVYNARRLKVPLDRFPTVMAVDAACMKLAAFEQAKPEISRTPNDPVDGPVVNSPKLGRAVLWMSGALISFCIMAVSVRGLAGRFSVFEILSIRSCLGTVVLAAIIVLQPQLRSQLHLQRVRMHLVRNGVHFAAQYAWALSLTLLPLATVVALEFTMPAWATLLAALLLAERLTPSRIGAIALGIIGVLVIVRPGTRTFQPAMLIILCAAVGYAASYIATKRLTNTGESPFAVVFWMTLMQLPMGLVGSDLAFPLKFDTAMILPALGIGLSGLSAHYCLSHAMHHADASVVVPLDFLRIPMLALIGWLVYDERLEAVVFAGAAIIVSGVLWNLRAESRRAASPGKRGLGP